MIARLPAGPIALDTVAFIYYIENHARFARALHPLFQAADAGRRRLVTSALTLLEVLVGPLRSGQAELAASYEAILTRSRGLTLVEIDRPQLRAAARLRALTHIRTPDALQLAAALQQHAAAFVTNDRRLPEIPGLPVFQLADLA